MGYVEDLRGIIGSRPIILVGSVAIIVDEIGRVLLQERKYPEGVWGIPGGLMELGESTEDVAKREILEETGYTIDDLKLINVYSGPDNFTIAENGDEFYVVTTAYFTKTFKGKLIVDKTESISCKFFHQNEIPDNMVKSHKIILDEFFKKHF